jgi:hypothetical protein
MFKGSKSRQSVRLFLQSFELGSPSPAGECVTPLWFRGGGGPAFAGEGMGGPNSDERTYTGTLGIYVLCVKGTVKQYRFFKMW